MTFKRPVSYVGTTVIDAERDVVCYTHEEYIAARIADALNHAPASEKQAQDPIDAELQRAIAKFPTWPSDPLHALAVLGEEFGELTKAMLQLTYEPHKSSAEEVREEALQTAAMALRLFRSLDRYEYRRGEQHEQAANR